MDSFNATLKPDVQFVLQDSSPWINWNHRWTAAILTIVVISITTRFFSAKSGTSKSAQDGSKTVPMVPYWLPIVGHLPQFGLNSEKLMIQARDAYKGGVFALNLGGTTHNIISSPTMGATLINLKHSIADMDSVGKHIMGAVFAYPKSALKNYDDGLKEVASAYKHLLSEPSLGNMVQRTVKSITGNIAHLVTFSESMVDQNEWERTSKAETLVDKDGELVVEASMLPLIRDFVAFNANPSLMGQDFINNNPDFFKDLWIFDRGFMTLATGLPRWLPLPKLLHSHIVRRRLINAIRDWEIAVDKHANGEDPGPEWQDLDDINPLLKVRIQAYRDHDFPMAARASLELSLLWAMNANVNVLIFWMLNHIYADRTLLAMLREEIAPHVQAFQPTHTLGIPEPPRLGNFDVEGLVSKCSLLKACYVESLRLDAAPWSFRTIQQDFVIAASRDKDAEKFLLKKGTYAHVPHGLHHTDPEHFDDPHTWKPQRHIKTETNDEGEEEQKVELGHIRPYGGGQSMCKGRAFAQKEALAFTAAFISMWDMEIKGGGPWKMPSYVSGAAIYTTNDDVRVWITRRKRLPEMDV